MNDPYKQALMDIMQQLQGILGSDPGMEEGAPLIEEPQGDLAGPAPQLETPVGDEEQMVAALADRGGKGLGGAASAKAQGDMKSKFKR